MATRRMRIKAVINVPRSVKSDPVDQVPATPIQAPAPAEPGGMLAILPASSPAPEPPPPDTVKSSPSTPPPLPIPSSPSPKSPRRNSGQPQPVQRPSPSKSPCFLPASGTILRRSPSPALSRLTSSPGPPLYPSHPPSPVKSPVPYGRSSSPVKYMSRTPVVILPTSMVQGPSTPSSGRVTPSDILKSPPNFTFRPPPSPVPSTSQEFPASPNNALVVSRPSPAQSPVFSRPSSFLYHHLNSNSNSNDSHEVASLMGNGVFGSPNSPSPGVPRGSGGAFSSVSNKMNSGTTPSPSPTPSASKNMLDDPDILKKRLEESRKKDAVHNNPTKFATVRKEFYEKLHSGHLPERNKMTILHYTFYNPPDPNGEKAKRKSRSRASSVCSELSTSSRPTPEPDLSNNENIGKASSAPSSIAGSRRTTASSVGSGGSLPASEAGQSEHGSTASSNGSSAMPGPRVKVGPDGCLIIDEKSLIVETSESQRARQQIEEMEVVSGTTYAVGSSGFYRYKKHRRGNEWTERETIRFYRALNQCGTDFSMMMGIFPYRTRHELKSKFKREDKKNPEMVSKVLSSCVFDPSEVFSDDEEEADEKEKLLQEEKEVEEVICSVDPPDPTGKKKKTLKKVKQEMEFSSAQKRELNVAELYKGPGMGKGRKWNTPVEGLVGKKLPASDPVPTTLTKIKKEKDTGKIEAQPKPKRKYVKKKKDKGTTDEPGTVSIIIAPGVLRAPILPSSTTTLAMVKEEKEPEKNLGMNLKDMPPKKRIRLPKAKPNLNSRTQNKDDEVTPAPPSNTDVSSQKGEDNVVCSDLFRFDASDPLGLKVIPAPLPVAQETELVGDEEGRDELVIVDLDELKSIQALAPEEGKEKETKLSKDLTTSAPEQKAPDGNRRRKRKKPTPAPVTTARILGDPYGKATLVTVKAEGTGGMTDGEGGGASKKVKVLPYRVPGPGGNLPSCPSSLADELEIEIELNTAPTTSSNES